MDDSLFRDFFCQPLHPYHQRYEALRAVFVEGRSQKGVAEQLGVGYSALRQWVYDFRRQCRGPSAQTPFFESQRSVAQ